MIKTKQNKTKKKKKKKKKKNTLIFVFLSYRDSKTVRISHGKRAIGIRAIEVRLYLVTIECAYKHQGHDQTEQAPKRGW